MYKEIDINSWNRKEHFYFFTKFDNPFFGIETSIDCTEAYEICKKKLIPFSLYYHFLAISAVNEVDEFRYRILNDKVVIFDTIHITTTIGKADNTFAFTFLPFVNHFSKFKENAIITINNIKATTGLGINENVSKLNVIHFSTLPWIKFSGIKHPQQFNHNDSIPKITFGKYYKNNNRLFMPISIHAHHGLMDAFHVGKYIELFESFMRDFQLAF